MKRRTILVPALAVLASLTLGGPSSAAAAQEQTVHITTTPEGFGAPGAVPLSPGRSAAHTSDLPAGRYALVTWVRDLRYGHTFAADGMRAPITIRDPR